jgi:hypothetical protein
LPERCNVSRARLLPSFVRLPAGLTSDLIKPLLDTRRSLNDSLEALMSIIRRVSVVYRALVRTSNNGFDFESANRIKGMQHPVILSSSCLRVTPRSIPSGNANHSPAMLDLDTRLLLYDLYAMTKNGPVASASNTRYPNCDQLSSRLLNDASAYISKRNEPESRAGYRSCTSGVLLRYRVILLTSLTL